MKYEGTRYNGYQKQPLKNTIQHFLEVSLRKIYRQDIRTVSSGRTDTGVHAEGQVVHYEPPKGINIPPSKLPQIINNHLPHDIQVCSIALVSNDFHSRYDAKVRQYRYRLWAGEPAAIPLNELAFVHPVEHIKKAILVDYLQPLVGYHDFTSFCHKRDPSPFKKREIFDIQLQNKGMILEVDFFANAFLRSMIRSIMGCALFAIKKQKPRDYLKKILLSQNPLLAKARAPANGLCLYRVFYTKIYGERGCYTRH